MIEKNLPSNEGFDTSARMDFFLIWSLDFLYVANDFPILREIEKDIHLFEYFTKCVPSHSKSLNNARLKKVRIALTPLL